MTEPGPVASEQPSPEWQRLRLNKPLLADRGKNFGKVLLEVVPDMGGMMADEWRAFERRGGTAEDEGVRWRGPAGMPDRMTAARRLWQEMKPEVMKKEAEEEEKKKAKKAAKEEADVEMDVDDVEGITEAAGDVANKPVAKKGLASDGEKKKKPAAKKDVDGSGVAKRSGGDGKGVGGSRAGDDKMDVDMGDKGGVAKQTGPTSWLKAMQNSSMAKAAAKPAPPQPSAKRGSAASGSGSSSAKKPKQQ